MDKIKIGVIGTGNMGKNHLRVLDAMPEYELMGLFDVDYKQAKTLADYYHITAFPDLEALFDHVDAVVIAVPSHLHKNIAVAAAKRKRHILVEKPIALNVGDAQQIIDACKINHVILMAGHIERFNPAVMELSKVIEQEEILSLDFRRLSPYDLRISDANVVQDLMIHDIDVLNAIVNAPIKRIVSQGICVYSGRLDYVQAMITFENGILASLASSRITESKVRKLEIHAKNAYIVTDFVNRTIDIMRKTKFILDVGHDMDYRQENVIEKVFVPISEPLKNEHAHFADCIINGKLPITNGEAAFKALSICEEISEKACQGTPAHI